VSRLPALLFSSLLVGAAFADVTVNGAAVSPDGGDGWDYEAPVVRLTGPGPFVVSGTDLAGGTVLRAESNCTVVASNLLLSAAATGQRSRGDGFYFADSVAEDGAGRSVAAFPEGLFYSSVPTAVLPPDDPAAASGSFFTWSDAWRPSNVTWEESGTNFAAVVWTGERFVAATFRGGFLVSENGAAWRAANYGGDPANLRAVARNADSGTLAAASTRGLWTSRDGGLSWSQATNHWANSVVWKDGLFVAVGYVKGGAGPQAVYWSADDGETWRARYFSDQPGELMFVVAGGGGRFLAGGTKCWRALHLENGELVSDGTAPVSATKLATAAGNGRYVASTLPYDTGLRVSTNGVDWTRADKQDATFFSIVWKDGRFLADGVVEGDGYRYEGLWASEDGASWECLQDGSERGLPALDCGAHAVSLSISGTGNGLEGGLYAPAVHIAPGGSLDVAAQGSAPAALQAFGNRYAAAFGGGLDEGAGAFVQRSATLFAAGGVYAPDIGPGRGGAATTAATILGGSLCPAGWWIDPAPSNDVDAVRCVVVENLAPGAAVSLANLPGNYGTNGIVADAYGRVYLWLPAAAESFRFIADGSLRRVAAGGNCIVEALPPPKVEEATFAAPTNGVMEVKMRVFSPVETNALSSVYATDLSSLSSGGGAALAPASVEQLSDDEYELTFRLPAAPDSGFLVIQAK
jgi:hypothetical protein